MRPSKTEFHIKVIIENECICTEVHKYIITYFAFIYTNAFHMYTSQDFTLICAMNFTHSCSWTHLLYLISYPSEHKTHIH